MRLGVSLAFDGTSTTAGDYAASLTLAEQTGFDSLWFFDTIGRGPSGRIRSAPWPPRRC